MNHSHSHQHSPRPRRGMLCLFAAAAFLLTTSTPTQAAPCSGSELQGSVFHDFNADGAYSVGNAETGIFGASIIVFSNDGSATSCESLADGSFGIDSPTGGFPVRVEVTLPAGGTLDALEPGASGLTSVFFASGPTTGLDVGFNVPIDFCQVNPDVMATCFLHGDPLFPGSLAADGDTLVSVDYDRTVVSPNHLALGSEVGAIWGLAYQKSSQSLFAAAVLKRHAGFGPLGIGGLYKVDYSSGMPVVSSFVDVTTLGVPVGTDPRSVPGEDPPGNGATGNEPGLDNLTYEEVGKVGLGGIEIEEEAGRLWAMNLGDGNLWAMDIGPDGDMPTSATMYPLPKVACTDGEFRPWAVKSYRGRIYIGGVCSNENISPYPPPGGFIDFPNLVGYVYSMDPTDSVFTLDLTIPLNYVKGCAGATSGCQWSPWTDLSTASLVPKWSGIIPSYPTPLLTDIEFADDGDMILGLSDRTGFQYGAAAPDANTNPTDTSISQVFAGGDMLRVDFDPSTEVFTLESNGIVGGVVGVGSGNNQGPGGGEYYSASTAGFHFELSLGGYAVLRGSNTFVGSSMDPVGINSGGLLWMYDQGATPGARFAGYTLYANSGPPTFAKGVGIGDVELRCEEAPIEIGNRVWCDSTDSNVLPDGIQGPGAPDGPLAGVTVELSCDGGLVTASTVTDANGNYLFDDSNVTGGIPAGSVCTLSVDYTQGAMGSCNIPTFPDAGGADPGADLRDSDGLDPELDGTVAATITVGGPGANDHSIDFGFTVLPAFGSLGDTVWCDGLEGFGNDTFNAGEGLAGITVNLFADTNCDGTADGGAIDSTETAGDGQYLFDRLPLGFVGFPFCYVTQVNAADPDLGVCTLPITPTTSASALDIVSFENLDNDFGFVEPCSDPDGDNICNELCMGDRDGDGVPDCEDVDPQGYLYCEATGEILPGGQIGVVGPGVVNIIEDGSTGRYMFLTDGTPGTYTLLVTPPAAYPMSTECSDMGILDPTGAPDPLMLGAGEDGTSGFLTSQDCAANPYYLTFELEPGDPFIINNNIPLGFCEIPVVEVPTLSEWSMVVLVLLLGLAGFGIMTRRRA